MAKFINPFTDVGTRMPWAAQNAVFQRLAEVLADGKRPQGRAAEVSKLSKEERIKYDHALKRYRDTLNAMAGAEQKGRAEGLAEGRAEGRAEGERGKAMDTARSMKADNMPMELISKYTGLTPDEIDAL